MKKINSAFLCLTLLLTAPAVYSQDIQFREIEGAILRRHSVLDEQLKQQPLSTNLNDYFPQWGFTPKNPIYVTSMVFLKKTDTELRVCFNISTNNLKIADIEKLFSHQGYTRAGGANCTITALSSQGVTISSSYYKDLDISRIVITSSLPNSLSTDIPLYSKKSSLTIPSNSTQTEILISSSLDQDTKTCEQGYTGTNAKVQSFFNTLCDGLSASEKALTNVTFGTQLQLTSSDNSNPLIINGCTLEFNNSCVLQFSIPNNSNFKRNRFYGQRLVWKEYIYAKTSETTLIDFVSQKYGLIGISVK